jgi:hypothetical protein
MRKGPIVIASGALAAVLAAMKIKRSKNGTSDSADDSSASDTDVPMQLVGEDSAS